MSLIDYLKSESADEQTGYETIQLSESDVSTLSAATDHPIDAIVARPHRDNGGIPAMQEVLESLHTVDTRSPRFSSTKENVSAAHAFELRYARPQPGRDRVLTLQYVPGSRETGGTLQQQLNHNYPDSMLERRDPTFLDGEVGQFVAGATLALRRYTLYPIKSVELEGFSSDPTGAIMEEMVAQGIQEATNADADVIVQAMFKPAKRDWLQGVSNGAGVVDDAGEEDPNGIVIEDTPSVKDLTYQLRQPTYEKNKIWPWRSEWIEHSPSKKNKDVAKMLEEQDGKAWRLFIRVFALSDDREVAIERAAKTAGMFRNFYEYRGEQTFIPQPLGNTELTEQLRAGATREWEDTGIVKTQSEVAGVVNIPQAEHVSTNKMRWSLSRPGEGIPPGTPRFDFEAAGVADGTEAEKQVAMLAETDPSKPYWYGFGSNYGVEAGVEPDILNVHQFVGGGTGKGKTTWLVNFTSQVMRRDNGALVFDPKGKDADEFIREWPEDRDEEDFVFVDLSDDYDKQVRFNFLEVPSDAPPDSRAFASAVEALCDDLVAMIAQAGGEDNYWGALMNRVSRTLIRGMSKSDRTCTLLDLACCCTAPENRERFAEWMSEERIHFIEDAAQRIREKEDSDLEPLAGRLDQWVQNDAIRNLISARESTVSIQEAVEEGKVIVVRNDPASGETEKRLFATALIRRAWVAAREAPESPPFYVICDEFDSIVTEESNIHSILSEARAFEFCLTLACQNPSNQLPRKVEKAIENQCETFISFNPGGKDDARLIAAQHSPDVTWEDLANISKYKFFMRTHDDQDELTHTYKVDSFPPIGDVRREVTGEPGMTDAELDAFKRRSVERYGDEPETPAEQKKQSHFYSAENDDDDEEQVDASAPAEQALYEATYSVQIKRDAQGGFVPADDVKTEWERRAGDLGFTSEVSNVIEQTPEEYLERERHDGESMLRLTPEGRREANLIQDTGSSASGGGDEHRWVLTESFKAFTKLDAHVELPTQEGEEDPDGVADLPIDPMAGETLSEIHEREERLKEEYPTLWKLTEGQHISIEAETSTITKPMQTLTNLRKAIEDNRLCVFAVKDGTAKHDEFGYWARRGEQILYQTEGPVQNQSIDHDRLNCVTDVDQNGNRRFYNKGAKYRPEPEIVALRPRNNYDLVWREDGKEVVMSDAKGNEFARFESRDEAANPSVKLIPAYYEHDPQTDEYTLTINGEKRAVESKDEIEKDWMAVRAPFIPEHEFGRDPTTDDFMFVIFPDDDNEKYDGPQIYEQGELRPLLDRDTKSEGEESREAGVATDEPEQDQSESGESDEDANPLLG